MEATGYHHHCLAEFLYHANYAVSVVNPLSVKRFIQMKLSKVKTDKSDAKAICEYACFNVVSLYISQGKSQYEFLQILRLIDIYTKQGTALKNKIHGENSLGIPSKLVLKSLNKPLKSLNKVMKILEDKLLELVKQTQKEIRSLEEKLTETV